MMSSSTTPNTDDSILSLDLIIAIVAAVVALLALIVGVGCCFLKKKKQSSSSSSSSSSLSSNVPTQNVELQSNPTQEFSSARNSHYLPAPTESAGTASSGAGEYDSSQRVLNDYDAAPSQPYGLVNPMQQTSNSNEYDAAPNQPYGVVASRPNNAYDAAPNHSCKEIIVVFS